MSAERFKNVTSLEIDDLLNNLILSLRPRRLSIRRYSARFRRIIVKYHAIENTANQNAGKSLYARR